MSSNEVREEWREDATAFRRADRLLFDLSGLGISIVASESSDNSQQ